MEQFELLTRKTPDLYKKIPGSSYCTINLATGRIYFSAGATKELGLSKDKRAYFLVGPNQLLVYLDDAKENDEGFVITVASNKNTRRVTPQTSIIHPGLVAKLHSKYNLPNRSRSYYIQKSEKEVSGKQAYEILINNPIPKQQKEAMPPKFPADRNIKNMTA